MTITSIQALRAVAAWMVVTRHVEQFLFDSEPDGFVAWLFWSRGGAGVEIFFVISGLIMVVATHERPTTRAAFLHRRIARIAPIYLLATLLMAALVPSSPGALAQSMTFSRALLDGGYPVLYVGWTLEYELVFYVLFALGLGRPWLLPLLLLALQFYPWNWAGAGMFRSSLMLLFAVGYLIGIAHVAGRLPRSRRGGVLLLAVGAACIGLGQGRETAWWSLGAIGIVAGALAIELKSTLASRLGDHSYAVYLIHPIAIVLALPFAAAFARSPWLTGALLGTIALAAWFVHARIERPTTLFLQRLLTRRRRRRKFEVSAASDFGGPAGAAGA
ncbi:acyltransferase family protein [Piscinibacter koreensis]|uniref:Acyltransferase n=1 Tax=Piscinibacter koreensis TaxID=2742824 RepID=A0A7Y6NLP6_9BURK|nr:acyltransferase [Schlegelella koreensis]NUZ05442.1 acyltransferase [Schlegelella koreensis]